MSILSIVSQHGRLSLHPLFKQCIKGKGTQLNQLFMQSIGVTPSNALPGISRFVTKCYQTPGHHQLFQRIPGHIKACAKPLRLSYKSLTFGLFPFSYLKRNAHKNSHELSQEILDHIPKEVFKKDVTVKKKKGNAIKRFFWRIWENMRLTFRFTRIFFTFGPLIVIYPFTLISKVTQRAWWNLLLIACELSGPTFIKLGQWASTRRDLFSSEFCDLFSKLHSSTRRHSWYTTKRKLRKAFGKRWREIFIKFDRKPIGSGCIAQVHKAYMAADMIPDESLIEDFMDDSDDEPEADFSEGIEILGFGTVSDALSSDPETPIPMRPKPKTQESGTGAARPAETTTPAFLLQEDEEVDSEDPKEEGSTWIQTQPDPNEIPHKEDEEFEEVPLIPVAVKVLHPGVFRLVSRDLRILNLCARIAETLIPGLKWLSLTESLDEFRELMIKQIDLRFEAECLEQFVENFEEIPNVRFPTPIRPYCKRDVLVETFEEGVPISNFLTEVDSEVDPFPEGIKAKLADIGADALLKMIFTDDFVHGDLHPGNILVQNAEHYVPNEESKMMLLDLGDTVIVNVQPVESPLRLVLLDVGITATLSTKDLENFKSVFKAVVLGEGEVVADLMLKHSRYNACKDIEAFKEELGKIVMEARQNTISLGTLKVGQLLSDVFAVLSKHKVKMESNFASVLLAIFVLEGLGRSLNPDLDLLIKAESILLGNA